MSVAGKQKGMVDENGNLTRSGLWYQLANAVNMMQPKFCIFENVAALLSNGLDRVLISLTEIGYNCNWQIISAADVGAPHLRKRIWITAYKGEPLYDITKKNEIAEIKNGKISVSNILSNAVIPMEFNSKFPQNGLLIDGLIYEVSPIKLYEQQNISIGTPLANNVERSDEFAKGRMPNPTEYAKNQEQWRTPTTADYKNMDCSNQVYLCDQVKEKKMYPTPNTMDSLPPKPIEKIVEYNQKYRPGRSYAAQNLREEVVYGKMDIEGNKLEDKKMWATPNGWDGARGPMALEPALNGEHQISLVTQVRHKPLWPTPTSMNAPEIDGLNSFNGKYYRKKDGRKHGTDLQLCVKGREKYSTPTVRDDRRGCNQNTLVKDVDSKETKRYPTPKASIDGTSDITLQMAVDGKAEMSLERKILAEKKEMWPTPDCSDRRSMKSKQWGLSNKVKELEAPWLFPEMNETDDVINEIDDSVLYPTPRAGNPGSRPNGKGGKILAEEVKKKEEWPTPKANEIDESEDIVINEKGRITRESGNDYGMNLTTKVRVKEKRIFPTPRAREGNSGEYGTASCERNAKKCYLDGVVKQEEKVVGNLNPDWVEFLMAYPKSWTNVEIENENLEPFEGWDMDPADMIIPKQWATPRANVAMSSAITEENSMNPNRFPNLETQVGREHFKNEEFEFISKTPRLTTVKKNRANRLKCLGNSIVPLCAYEVFRQIIQLPPPKGGGL